MQKSVSNSEALAKWESPFGAYKATFKNHFFARKSAHITMSFDEIFHEVAGWRPWAFERGIVGIYTTLQVIGPDGKKYLWLCLDVESPKHHDSRSENIRIAQSFFLALIEARLSTGLYIALTSRGFRFYWPYLIPPEFSKAFKIFCEDQGCVDLSTLTPSNFTRHFANFKNRDKYRQHKTPFDGHPHLIK